MPDSKKNAFNRHASGARLHSHSIIDIFLKKWHMANEILTRASAEQVAE